MKTAMQELIFKLPNEFIADNPSIILELLQKEKEQIRDAYNEGHTDAMEDKPGMTSGTIYYNETYNQDRELSKDVKDLLDNYNKKK